MSYILQCPNFSSTPREGRTGYPWVLPFNLWELFTPFPQKNRAEGRRRLVVSPSPAPWLLSQPVTERWGGGEMNECPLVPQPVLPHPAPSTSTLPFPLPLDLPLDFLSYSCKVSQSSISELKSFLSHLLCCLKAYLLIVEWLHSGGQGENWEYGKGRRVWGVD